MDRKTLLLEHGAVVSEGDHLSIPEYSIVSLYLACEGYELEGGELRYTLLTGLEWIIPSLRERDGVSSGVPLWSGYPEVSDADSSKVNAILGLLYPIHKALDDWFSCIPRATLIELVSLLWGTTTSEEIDTRLGELAIQLLRADPPNEEWKTLKLVTQEEVDQWLEDIRSKLEGLL